MNPHQFHEDPDREDAWRGHLGDALLALIAIFLVVSPAAYSTVAPLLAHLAKSAATILTGGGQ